MSRLVKTVYAPIETLSIVREHAERLEKELIALAMKTPLGIARSTFLDMALEKIAVTEIVRALIRILDKYSYLLRIPRTSIELKHREVLETILTKVVELTKQQQTSVEVLRNTVSSIEYSYVRELIQTVLSIEERILKRLEDLEKKLREEILHTT